MKIITCILSKLLSAVIILTTLVAVYPPNAAHAWTKPKLAAVQFGGTGFDGAQDSAIDSESSAECP